MHNSHQSFASRQRPLNHDGDAGNQVVWFVAPGEEENYNNTMQAFAVIDEWMANIAANPDASVAANRPLARRPPGGQRVRAAVRGSGSSRLPRE